MKQLETREVVLGNNTFYIRPLPAFKAANMTGELVAVVLPILTGLAPLLGGENANKSILDVDLEKAAPSVTAAFSAISGDKLEKLVKQLLLTGKTISVQTADSEKTQLLTEDLSNEIFCEEVQDMFLLAFEVIRSNYNGFFKKLSTRFGPVIKMLRKTVEK